ncbi:dethiobiotin synthase [Raineya orbicola]|jgi:dethiobiotin synthetase|uniref:ATP-dependent dethiobiotin synthetase BioD n=1 Tax=Raineya orbicola TaxID=2016530 RepID=A0A2N3IJ12_9BACT|nr:dethiobiotin synthase [Raineya orbicola]PKQ70223.1 bioD: dethiobiotin synthase [Raineya orbicola]
MRYFVTAIGTDSGKTITSAILVEALKADYWKPVQSGYPRDSETVADLVSFPVKIFPSSYEFAKPASPHDSAKAENKIIELAKITLPQTDNHLIIEGAGGILVPLNDQDFVIDIAQKFDLEIILVVNLYLGCINHTLLSVRELQRRNLKVKGIVFNGVSNPESERIILHHSGYQELLHIEKEALITPLIVQKYAEKIKNIL